MNKFLHFYFAVFAGVFLLLSSAWAINLEIGDPCSNRIKIKIREPLAGTGPNVGQFTIDQLKKNRIKYVGTVDGLNSIFGTPVSDASVEVVGPNEMFAYGWCFEVNHAQPSQRPVDIVLRRDSDLVYWFFGYAHFKNGQWLNMCVPAHTRPLKSYCQRSWR